MWCAISAGGGINHMSCVRARVALLRTIAHLLGHDVPRAREDVCWFPFVQVAWCELHLSLFRPLRAHEPDQFLHSNQSQCNTHRVMSDTKLRRNSLLSWRKAILLRSVCVCDIITPANPCPGHTWTLALTLVHVRTAGAIAAFIVVSRQRPAGVHV